MLVILFLLFSHPLSHTHTTFFLSLSLSQKHYFLSFFHSLTHTTFSLYLSFSLSLSHTHTHLRGPHRYLSKLRTIFWYYIARTPSLSHTLPSFSLPLSNTHYLLSLSLSHIHSNYTLPSFARSLSHTHYLLSLSHTHYLFFSLSLTLPSLSLSRSLFLSHTFSLRCCVKMRARAKTEFPLIIHKLRSD